MEVIFTTDLSLDQACMSYYDTSNGVMLKSFKNSSCCQNGYGWIGNDIIVAGQDKKQLIHCYDTHKEQILKKIVCPDKVSCLAVSPDGHYMVVALVEKIYIWQVPTGNLINILSSHYQRVNKISFTTDGVFFITCGDDNLVLVWNLMLSLQPVDLLNPDSKNNKPYHTLSNHSMPVKDIYVGITGTRSRLVTASLDQTCKMFDICSGRLICSFIFDDACCCVTMDTTERQLFLGTNNGKIYIVNFFKKCTSDDAHIPQTKSSFFQAHSKKVNSLSVSMDCTRLLSASADCTVKLWHISSRQCLRTFSFKGEVTNALFTLYPAFLHKSYQPPKVKRHINNFKRAIFTPSEHLDKIDFDNMEMNDENSMKIVLKDIKTTDFPSIIDDDEVDHSNYERVKAQLTAPLSCNSDSLENASRTELIQKIEDLETMAKGFYQLASEKLLSDVQLKNNDGEDKEET